MKSVRTNRYDHGGKLLLASVLNLSLTIAFRLFIQIVREFEIVVNEELGLQFEFILAPQSPVSLGFRDRMSRAEMT